MTTMNDLQKRRFADALERVAGDEDMLGMLAKIAVEDAPEMIEMLDTQVEGKLLSDAAKTAHSLKGLLSAFETGEPVSDLQPLIDAARQGDSNDVVKLHSEVGSKLEKLLSEIGGIIS